MLEGVGVEGVAKKLVSLPIILHPTAMHPELNEAHALVRCTAIIDSANMHANVPVLVETAHIQEVLSWQIGETN